MATCMCISMCIHIDFEFETHFSMWREKMKMKVAIDEVHYIISLD